MKIEKFPPHSHEELNNYVYGLIDNGEVFYIGRGRGNRCFHHVTAARKRLKIIKKDGEVLDEKEGKFIRIIAAEADSREINVVLYRHGMSKDQAIEVEAVLIENFLTYKDGENQNRGYEPERGNVFAADYIYAKNAMEIELDIDEIMLVPIKNSLGVNGKDIREAASYSWKLGEKNKKYRSLLLAVGKFRRVEGVFRIVDLLTEDDFRQRDPVKFQKSQKKRWAFDLEDVTEDIRKKYIGKLVPAGKLQAGPTKIYRPKHN